MSDDDEVEPIANEMLFISASIGVFAVATALVHKYKQARAGAPHLDHATPLLLLVAIVCKLPHTALSHDTSMLVLNSLFAVGWGAVFAVSFVPPIAQPSDA